MVKNPKKIPIGTNLIKWLNKFESSLLEDKEKIQLYGVDDE